MPLVVFQNFVIFQIRYPETFRVVSGTTCNTRRVSFGKNSGKILIRQLLLLDKNRSGQFSKIMSKSFRFNFCVGVSGRFSYTWRLYAPRSKYKFHGAIGRLFCLSFFCDERKKTFLWPNKNFCFSINLVVLNLKIVTLNNLNCDLPTQYLLSRIADFDVISWQFEGREKPLILISVVWRVIYNSGYFQCPIFVTFDNVILQHTKMFF